MGKETTFDDVRSIPAAVLHRAAAEPASVAIRQQAGGVWWETTWAELAARMDLFGAALLAEGVSAEQGPVAILGGTTLDTITTSLAVQAVGAATLNVGPSAPSADLAKILADVTYAFVEDQEQYDRLVESGAADRIRCIVAYSSRGLTDVGDPRLIALPDYLAGGSGLLGSRSDVLRRAASAVTGEDLAAVLPGVVADRPTMASHRHLLDVAQRLTSGLELLPGTAYVHSTTSAASLAQYLTLGVAPVLPLSLHLPERGTPVTAAWRDVTPLFVALEQEGWAEIARVADTSMSRGSRLVRLMYQRTKSVAGSATNGAGRAGGLLLYSALRRQLGLGRVRRALCLGGPPPPGVVDFCRRQGVDLTELYAPAEVGPIAMRTSGTGDGAYTILPSSSVHPWDVRSRDGRIEVRASSVPSGPGADPWVDCGDAGEVRGRSLHLEANSVTGPGGSGFERAVSTPTPVEESTR